MGPVLAAVSEPQRSGTPHTAESGERQQLRKPNRKLQHDEIDDLVQRYEAGASMSELARTYGMHFQTVRAHLRRRGVDIRTDHPGLLPVQIFEAAELYQQGHSSYDLAMRYGVDRSTVTKYLKRAGVQLRSHPGKRLV